jgi:hypothetical protein
VERIDHGFKLIDMKSRRLVDIPGNEILEALGKDLPPVATHCLDEEM